MNAITTADTFGQQLARFDGQVAKIANQLTQALPSHISIEKFQRTLMAAVKADPDLLRADRASLINACEKAALDGLFPDKREAALVLFKRNYKDAQGNWQQAMDVVYMPMAYGLRKKILQSNEVTDITAKVVYRAEVQSGAFIYEEGTEAMLRHRPLLEMTEEEAGDDNIVAAYSMATYKDGSKSYEVLRRFEIDKVRECSQTGATSDRKGQPRKSSGPWVDFYAEMAKKTAMRRHSKTLPMSGDLLVDIEANEHDVAASAARMLQVEPDAPVALPNPEQLAEQDQPRQALAEHLDDEIPTSFDKDTGEIIDEPARDAATGMTEVDESTARALDAGEHSGNGTLSDDSPSAAEGPADEQRGDPEHDDKPVWHGKVEWIRSATSAAKNKQHLKSVDDEFTKIRVGLPDEVIEELDGLISARRRELTKTAEGEG